MVNSLFGSAKALSWNGIAILALTFMFGVTLVQMCAHYVSEFDDHDETTADIEKYFGSVSCSMKSLVMATMGGEDWVNIARPLERVGQLAYTTFLGYIYLFAYGIVNIMNAIFIEAMMENSQSDNQFIIDSELQKKGAYVEKLQSIFDSMNDNGDGEVSFEEFERHVNDDKMIAFLSSLQLDVTDATHFFRVLSDNGKESVDIERFVGGCIKLRGLARSTDLMHLSLAHARAMKAQLRFFKEAIANHEHALAKRLERLSLESPRTFADTPGCAAQITRQMAALRPRINELGEMTTQASGESKPGNLQRPQTFQFQSKGKRSTHSL